MKYAALIACLCFAAVPAAAEARPLVTHSEETPSRLCLAADDEPHRLMEICATALERADLTRAERVELLTALGEARLWDDRPDEATEAFSEALELDPSYLGALNGIAWALRDTEGEEAAFGAFERSLSVAVSVQALSGKAATGRSLGRLTEEEARQLLRAALAIDPDYIWGLREIAWSHFDEGGFAASLAVFDEVLAIEMDDVNAHFGRGRALLRLDKFDEALEAFAAALALDPEDYASRLFHITTLRGLDRNAQALRESERLVEDYPGADAPHVEKALALAALGRRGAAIEALRDADRRLGPSNRVLYWLADTLILDARPLEAMAAIDRAIALDGADQADWLLKSYIALELEDYPAAREAALRSIEIGGDDPWAQYYVALSFVHEGRPEEGLDRFDEAMAGGLPEHRIGDFARALIGQGRYVEAIQLRLKY